MDAELNIEVLCDECSSPLSSSAEEVSGKIHIKVINCASCTKKTDEQEDIDLDLIINGMDRQSITLQGKVG